MGSVREGTSPGAPAAWVGGVHAKAARRVDVGRRPGEYPLGRSFRRTRRVAVEPEGYGPMPVPQPMGTAALRLRADALPPWPPDFACRRIRVGRATGHGGTRAGNAGFASLAGCRGASRPRTY